MNQDDIERNFRERAESAGFKGADFQSVLFTAVHGLIRMGGDVMVECGSKEFMERIQRPDALVNLMQLCVRTAMDIATAQRADPVKAKDAVFALALPARAMEQSIALRYIFNYVAQRGAGVSLRTTR